MSNNFFRFCKFRFASVTVNKIRYPAELSDISTRRFTFRNRLIIVKNNVLLNIMSIVDYGRKHENCVFDLLQKMCLNRQNHLLFLRFPVIFRACSLPFSAAF